MFLYCETTYSNAFLSQVQTTIYIIMKCRLDSKVKTEVEFSPENASSVCVLAEMENEYTISVEAPSKPG